MQQRSLDDAGRAEFLAQFVPHPAKTLLGFAVMGGIFGEGVDLVGDRLIGCAIVGVGLPQVNPRQEMLRRYYEEQSGCGFDYAYRYPGMNKVLQAAGRVVRTRRTRAWCCFWTTALRSPTPPACSRRTGSTSNICPAPPRWKRR